MDDGHGCGTVTMGGQPVSQPVSQSAQPALHRTFYTFAVASIHLVQERARSGLGAGGGGFFSSSVRGFDRWFGYWLVDGAFNASDWGFRGTRSGRVCKRAGVRACVQKRMLDGVWVGVRSKVHQGC